MRHRARALPAALLVLAATLLLLGPQWARAARAQAETPTVTQQIRYIAPEAQEVVLIWGVDGWQVLPEAQRPAGTTLRDGVMRTPLAAEGGAFSVAIEAPAATGIEYVFQLSAQHQGATFEAWDTNKGAEQPFYVTTAGSGPVELAITPELAYDLRAEQRPPPLIWLGMAACAGLTMVAVGILLGGRGAGPRLTAGRGGRVRWAATATGAFLSLAMLYIAAMNSQLYLWGDNVHYIAVAKSFVTGQGLRSIHLVGSPTFTYPIPIFPLMLAPLVGLFGYNLLPMKALVGLFGILSAYLAYRYFAPRIGRRRALLVALLAAVAPPVVSFSHQVMSEVPYTALSLLALIAVERYGRAGRAFSRAGLIAAACLSVAYLTRTIGIALLLAAALWLMLDSRPGIGLRIRKACLALGLAAAVWAGFNFPIILEMPYIREFTQRSPYADAAGQVTGSSFAARLSDNLRAYGRTIPEAVAYPLFASPSRPLAVLTLAVLAAGFIACLRRRRSPAEYYVLAYMAILLAYEPSNLGNIRRYLVPLSPFILYYAAEGLYQLTMGGFALLSARLRRARPGGVLRHRVALTRAALALGLALMATNMVATARASVLKDERGEMFQYQNFHWEQYRDAARWTAQHTAPDSVIMTRMAHVFHFDSRRTVAWYPWIDAQDRAGLLETLLTTDVDYIVVDSLDINQSQEDLAAMEGVLKAHPDYFQLAYENRSSSVYRVTTSAALAGQAPITLEVDGPGESAQ